MMPGIFESTFSDDQNNDDLNAPVVSLKEGLPVRELLNNHETEFEVRPDEDEGFAEANSAESCFNFDELEKVINLDVIDTDPTEDGEDGTPFDKYRRKMHNVRDDGKLLKYVKKEGVGPLVPDNCVVYIRYQAYVEYAEVPFDSTLWQCSGEGDFPVPVNLWKGQLLLGLHEAVLTMRKKEKAEFLVHPDLAYGQLGCPPRIPPEATVLFIVEIDRFVDCGDMHINNDELSMHERNEFNNVYKIAKGHYLLANDLFKRETYNAALNKYREVINLMHNARLANEEEEKVCNHFLIRNYTNACVCYKKLSNYKKICTMASDALRVSEKEALKNYKLLYFWGYAKMMLNDYDVAAKHLKAAQRLQPHYEEIETALLELSRKKADDARRERIMMQRAFRVQPAQATVTEINETEETFRNCIKEQLEEFRDSPNRELTLTDHFTGEEEMLCVDVAQKLGLYARVVAGNTRVILIKKPADM